MQVNPMTQKPVPIRTGFCVINLLSSVSCDKISAMAGSLRFLCALGAIGGEATGALAHLLWKDYSTKGRLAEAFRRLQTSGQIDILGTGPLDERTVRLTARGHHTCLAGIDPEARWARPWDGTWRIVAFDIPEKDSSLRAALRRKLHEHRFGWLQNSVWITPDPIEEFRALMSEKRLLPESLTLLDAKPSGGESNEAMVTSAWDFDALDKGYEHYLEILRLRPNRQEKILAWLDWLEMEHRAWAQLAAQDPFLPQMLLPRFYRGQTVWKTRQEAHAAFREIVR